MWVYYKAPKHQTEGCIWVLGKRRVDPRVVRKGESQFAQICGKLTPQVDSRSEYATKILLVLWCKIPEGLIWVLINSLVVGENSPRQLTAEDQPVEPSLDASGACLDGIRPRENGTGPK